MDLDKVYREFLSRVHREILKPAGFRKEGGNFRICYDNGLCKIINFQRSMFNGDGECRFCINLGLYIQPDRENPNLKFKEYDCCVRQRAACMDPTYGRDHWWCIFEGRDMEKLFAEVQLILTGSTLPWMAQFECRQDVIRAGQKGLLKNFVCRNI